MNRVVYLDVLKAFAILLVVLGHSIQFINWGGYKSDIIFNIVYTFHMPLFMAVSGYFFLGSLKLGFFELLCKKSFALLWPAILWSIPKMVMSSGSIIDVLIYNIWFLKSLFICYIVYYCFYKFMGLFYGCIFIILVSILLPLSILPGYLNMMLPSFALGIAISQKKEILLSQNTRFDFILFLSYIILFIFRPADKTPDGIIECFFPLQINIYSLLLFFYRMIMAFVAVILCFRIFSKCQRTSPVISYIGSSTLCIYLLNGVFSDVLMHLPLPRMNWLITNAIILLVTILQLLLYYKFIRYVDKYPKLNMLLFARKQKNPYV